MSSRASLSRIFVLCSLLLVAAQQPARAGDFGLRGGIYLDDTDPFIGVEWLGDLRGRWDVNPNLEVVFPDNADRYSLNLDFHRDFDTDETFTFWLGGGFGLVFTDPDNRRAGEDTDLVLDLLAGIGAGRGAVRPYGQLKVVVGNDSELVVMAGLRF